MDLETINLCEGPLVHEFVDAFPGGEFTAVVLPLDSFRPASFQGYPVSLFELLE
jgi:hypothetical protein